ncbi:MAG: hypothetical protein ACFFDS_09480, partial [Candidatus Thorarchaeota archaeon]
YLIIQVNNFQTGEDSIACASPGDLTVHYESESLLYIYDVDGVDIPPLSTYLTALRSVTYENTSEDPDTSDRTFRFSVVDYKE